MKCTEFENKIIDFLEKKLSESETSKFEKHKASCKTCKQKLLFIESTFNFIETEKKENVNQFISTRIISKTEATNNKFVLVKKALQPIMAAAMITIAVIFGNFLSETYLKTNNQITYNQDSIFIDKPVQFVINDISYEDYYFINSQ